MDLMMALRVIATVLSPTWFFADFRKQNKEQEVRSKDIWKWNITYLVVAVIASITSIVLHIGTDQSRQSVLNIVYRCWLGVLVYGYFLFSRCAEIFIAFAVDAVEKMDQRYDASCPSRSALKPSERVLLAASSYIELVLNFALLYMMLPRSAWQKPCSNGGSWTAQEVADFIYFSATTITTSGNGLLIPCSWPSQLLSTCEIACGLILLVVCFTIYTGIGRNTVPPVER